MKVEIHCPDCHSVWHVDESAGGEMLCPSCMTRIPLQPWACAGGEIDLPLAPPAGSPRASERRMNVDRPQAPSMDDQVVCPRCKLHFHPREMPAEAPSSNRTVLVVDDLAYFREIAKDALEPIFEVKTAATCEQARDLLRAGGIDLLVLDLTLDGTNAGRDLLAELTPKPCPILIFTAKDESELYGESWDELQKLGADDLVIKGMRVAESLLRKASALLGVTVDEMNEPA